MVPPRQCPGGLDHPLLATAEQHGPNVPAHPPFRRWCCAVCSTTRGKRGGIWGIDEHTDTARGRGDHRPAAGEQRPVRARTPAAAARPRTVGGPQPAPPPGGTPPVGPPPQPPPPDAGPWASDNLPPPPLAGTAVDMERPEPIRV